MSTHHSYKPNKVYNQGEEGGSGELSSSYSHPLSQATPPDPHRTSTNQERDMQEQVQEQVQKRIDLFTKLHRKQELRATKHKQISPLQQALTKKKKKKNEATKEAKDGSRRQLRQSSKKQDEAPPTKHHEQETSSDNHEQSTMYPRETQSFLAGMSLVDRSQFAEYLDLGVPLDDSFDTNQKVLVLHAPDALPPSWDSSSNTREMATDYNENAEDALHNCNYVNVILTEPRRSDQCIAIMGQYNSYHVHKYMRAAETRPTQPDIVVDKNLPLRQVPRGAHPEHQFTTKTPTLEQTQRYWNTSLVPYLTNLDQYQKQVAVLLPSVSLCKSVIVMVCNYGQAELLMNFVCHARARDLDLSGILVFATDPETEALAKDLGLSVYYNEQVRKNQHERIVCSVCFMIVAL